MDKLTDFTTLQIKLASPEVIKSWSHGEVLKPETINYRTLKPEKDGLFCERIFGPTKDWECYCGKYKRIRYRGIICDKCGVEVTQSRVRRERMGHINLACSVAHIWFFKGTPSHLSLLLGISPRNLSGVIYFAKYLVIETDKNIEKSILKDLDKQFDTKIKELEAKNKQDIKTAKDEGTQAIQAIKTKIKSKEQKDLAINEAKLKLKRDLASLRETLMSEKDTTREIFTAVKDLVKKTQPLTVFSEEEYLKLVDYNAADFMKVGMGAEAILEVIKAIDLNKMAAKFRQEIQKYSGQRQIKATKVLRIIEAFNKVGIDPSWMIISTLPVIPPDLRPMVQLSGGHFASSDINDLYRRVINRNNRLKHLINLGAPEIILRNEKRMLQESVDTLIDTSQARTVRRRGSKELRSLADMLRGKQGRFRQNLLGKRVDYSGRSVIVVGPDLKLNQAGIPKLMALEIFKPYVLRELINRGHAPNVKSAKHVLERKPPEVFDILEDIIKDHPILLNRAPTLHKLGIQAFFPVLVEGSAIQIHPCVCAGYNADFDGDQMAIHVPLSKDARKESQAYMMPANNLLKPADGSPITFPNKEMALGIYYLTSVDSQLKPDSTLYASEAEAILASQARQIQLRQAIKVRRNKKITDTTVGRLLFNQALPEGLGFINQAVNAAGIKALIKQTINSYSSEETAKLIDDLKDLGFDAVTLSGLSVAVADCRIIPEKEEIIKVSNKKASLIEENYKNGLITQEEKRRLSNELWMDTTDNIAEKTWDNFEANNAVKVIIDSGGTRASKDQVKQLAAMRGLVIDPLGKIVELPTKSNFREGLSIFEYVTSSRGSRKGLTDSAIKTADAGYLTRRLVDVAHDMIIRQENCQTNNGLIIKSDGKRSQSFITRITGRILAETLKHPRTKKTLAKKGELVDESLADAINKAKVPQANVRSPLTCKAKHGLCAICYGWDFSTKKKVTVGAPVGVVAAQSIGEPGTQLTMRVKHFGGIVVSDVTQGLPRVEELFEARNPKVVSPLSEMAGKVTIEETSQGYEVTITPTQSAEAKTYLVPLTSTLKVKNNQLVGVGQRLASGALNIKSLLEIRGLTGTQEYLVEQIQNVYESQGIPIHDKHFEIIVRKMSDKFQIETVGDTDLLAGEFIEKTRFDEENDRAKKAKAKSATAQQVILGITRSSLHTESWLSAASFQHTSAILTNAAASGKVDKLLGLKENVIIGRLIPTSEERAKLE
jgi:DNA-directed RNA polymerase subunit beta'